MYYGGDMSIPYTSPYPIEKVQNSQYLYSYSINVEIPRQNGNEFGQLVADYSYDKGGPWPPPIVLLYLYNFKYTFKN